MKFLIIGGSGFLGSHVADHLSSLGNDVSIFDKNESTHLKKNQKFFKGDIKRIDNYKNIFKGVDYVYNFAGISDIEASKKNLKKQYWKIFYL